MSPIVKFFLLIGLVCLIIGGVIYLVERIGIPLGHLPGDFRIQLRNLTCFIPLATAILLSILLTVLLNVITRLLKK